MRSRAIERDKVNNQCAGNYVKQPMTFIIRRKSAHSVSENGTQMRPWENGVCENARETRKHLAPYGYVTSCALGFEQ